MLAVGHCRQHAFISRPANYALGEACFDYRHHYFNAALPTICLITGEVMPHDYRHHACRPGRVTLL